ncbi:MAG: desulfoferrodoxin family protein [Bacilli bacterium]
MKELKIKKCNKCGALFEEIEDCSCQNCKLICCEEEMIDLIPNIEEASFEKHIPIFEIEGENIKITVNHVMEEDHFIEWIKVITKNQEITKYFNPKEELNLILPLEKDMIIYSYCNKHGLWKKEV